jgi:nicotinate-nucleotide adenylyltransferase
MGAMSQPSGKRIGLFGGTFDPIHAGHLLLADSAREWASLDVVLFLPSASPPHKPGGAKGPKAAFPHRVRMAEIATAPDPGFIVSGREGLRPGPSYTVDLLREVRRERGPGAQLFFLIGADWVGGLGTWREIGEIFSLCRFLVVPRPGFPRAGPEELAGALGAEKARLLDEGRVPAPEIGISSTDIRKRLASGRSVRYLLPPGVEDYIRANGLYGTAKGSSRTAGGRKARRA